MVLVHGFTDTWRGWTPVLAALEAHHDVVALNLPGHFGGEPWDASVPLSISATVDAVDQQLDALGIERAHLVGSSLGGWVCLVLASRGRALSVTGVCPAGGWEPGGREERAVARFFRRNQMLLRRSRRMLPTVARSNRLRRFALRELVAYPGNVSPADALAMMEGARNCSVADAVLELAGSGDPFGELGPITCPVRILYGTGDRVIRWPSHYSRMRRALPDADWVQLDGLGHLPMWDDPAAVAKAILEGARQRPL
jgi:pimeloyl-ACP methyl ester carboxylesterase